MESEAQLVSLCLAGDQRAWSRLFERHYSAAARFVFQTAPDLVEADVEEVCQDAFLSVVRNLASFHGQSRLQTWVFRIAANKARDFREKRDAAKRGGGQLPLSLDAPPPGYPDLPPPDPPSPAPGPDAQLARKDEMRVVRQALDEIGDPCREILELRYFGGLHYDEIAATLELNQKTASSRLSKCLDELEAIVRRKLHDFPVQ